MESKLLIEDLDGGQMLIATDAKGVNAATSLLESKMDLMAGVFIRPVCLAIINRYDKSKESAKLVEDAYEILSNLNNGHFIFRISTVTQMCEYLIKPSPPKE